MAATDVLRDARPRPARVALVGPNGAGKSTPQGSGRRSGAYFATAPAAGRADGRRNTTRTRCGPTRLVGGHAVRRTSSMLGFEARRVQRRPGRYRRHACRCSGCRAPEGPLAGRPHVGRPARVALDEPTNHLDMRSRRPRGGYAILMALCRRVAQPRLSPGLPHGSGARRKRSGPPRGRLDDQFASTRPAFASWWLGPRRQWVREESCGAHRSRAAAAGAARGPCLAARAADGPDVPVDASATRLTLGQPQE